MRIFKKSVYFLFESGSLDSPGGPSSNRRYSITGVLRRRVIMNFTSKGPAEAKSTITLRRIHLIRRPYAKRRGRRETMFDCPLSKTVKILDQRSCSTSPFECADVRSQGVCVVTRSKVQRSSAKACPVLTVLGCSSRHIAGFLQYMRPGLVF